MAFKADTLLWRTANRNVLCPACIGAIVEGHWEGLAGPADREFSDRGDGGSPLIKWKSDIVLSAPAAPVCCLHCLQTPSETASQGPRCLQIASQNSSLGCGAGPEIAPCSPFSSLCRIPKSKIFPQKNENVFHNVMHFIALKSFRYTYCKASLFYLQN